MGSPLTMHRGLFSLLLTAPGLTRSPGPPYTCPGEGGPIGAPVDPGLRPQGLFRLGLAEAGKLYVRGWVGGCLGRRQEGGAGGETAGLLAYAVVPA